MSGPGPIFVGAEIPADHRVYRGGTVVFPDVEPKGKIHMQLLETFSHEALAG